MTQGSCWISMIKMMMKGVGDTSFGGPIQTDAPTVYAGPGLSFCCPECSNLLTYVSYVSFHFLYWEVLSHGVRWILVCPLVDFTFMSMDTVSLAMSRHMTEPPKGLLTHLQSTSCKLMEAGAGSRVSDICENRIQI